MGEKENKCNYGGYLYYVVVIWRDRNDVIFGRHNDNKKSLIGLKILVAYLWLSYRNYKILFELGSVA